jgi:hypothetical protein
MVPNCGGEDIVAEVVSDCTCAAAMLIHDKELVNNLVQTEAPS